MKVVKVGIKDFKAILHLEEEINGANILLLGDNGVGKSSFIQFIEIALGKQTDIPEECSGSGYVVTDRNGLQYTFRVEFKKGKPVVTVETPDGLKDNRKSVLASIVGAIDFDIDEFVKLSDTTKGRREQVEIFLSLLPDDIKEEISKQERRVEAKYNERAEKNKEAKMLEGALSEHDYKKHPMAPDLPYQTLEEYDKIIAEKNEQITKASEVNSKIESVKARMSDRDRNISSWEDEIVELQKKIAEAKNMQTETKAWLENNKPVEVTELTNYISNLQNFKSVLLQKFDYDKKFAQLSKLKEEAGECTAFIESSRQVIEDTIKDFDIGVPGLKYGTEELLYNNIPVNKSNLSTSEIMELGVKMKMAQNKDLGILFIQRGESLGAARLKEIQDLAKANDWQIIMEQVDRGNDKLTVQIMEG